MPSRREFIGTATALALCARRIEAAAPLLDVPLQTDAAGRLLAPTYVNGHGPLRFMVDTGASHCAVTQDLARRLALPAADSVAMTGTTTRSPSRAVTIGAFEIGALRLENMSMPVIDAPNGILGANAFTDRRLEVDMAGRRLALSAGDSVPATGIPLERRFGGLLLASGKVGTADCSFIIDTGAQRSIGNPALARRLSTPTDSRDPLIVGDVAAPRLPPLPVTLGTTVTLSIAVAALPVFTTWQLPEHPAVLLGMDFFSRLSRFNIDYKHARLNAVL